MHILIIEDNDTTARYLAQGLGENCYVTTLARDGQEGLYWAQTQVFDLIIVDVMLPILNGWEVVQRIRKTNQQIPILFLTAKHSVDDRVHGFECGADDYLPKPFALVELLMRIKALLKRAHVSAVDVIEINDLILNVTNHTVYRGQKRIHLTAKEFMLLHLLAAHQNEVLSRKVLVERVWDIHFETQTNVIDVAIRRLRDKMDRPPHAPLIHTVRGAGYVLQERMDEE